MRRLVARIAGQQRHNKKAWPAVSIVGITTAAAATLAFWNNGTTLDHHNETTNEKSVLIIGCGLTGALTAQRLLHQYNKEKQPSDKSKLEVKIEIVERATYSAGRFGARSIYQGAMADLGAQVLSTVHPDDPRARGGQNITRDNLTTAQSIVDDLQQNGILQRIPDSALGETNERMIWEDLWQHYAAPKGLTSVLQALLPEEIHPIFRVKVDAVQRLPDGRWLVQGTERTEDNDQAFSKTYDCVVVCVPAPNVLEIEGLREALDAPSIQILERVGYDARICQTHFFDPRMRPALQRAFRNKLELSLEDISVDKVRGVHHGISYVSWQDPKRNIPIDDTTTPCALTVHGQAGYTKTDLRTADLDDLLAQITELSSSDIRQYRRHSRSISWDVSQMIRPMEAVVADPPSPNWQCLVSASPRSVLVVAGDFMTQSSFLGCVASAESAAQTVWRALDELPRK